MTFETKSFKSLCQATFKIICGLSGPAGSGLLVSMTAGPVLRRFLSQRTHEIRMSWAIFCKRNICIEWIEENNSTILKYQKNGTWPINLHCNHLSADYRWHSLTFRQMRIILIRIAGPTFVKLHGSHPINNGLSRSATGVFASLLALKPDQGWEPEDFSSKFDF